MMDSIPNVRKFSLHERYSLMRRNTGYPVHVGFIVTYPSASALPSLSHLHQRVRTLQEHFPLLCAEIKGGRTVKPWFEGRQEGIWKDEDLVRVVALGSKGEMDEDSDNEERNRLLRDEIQRMAAKDTIGRPFWQVSLFTSEDIGATPTISLGPSGKAYLTLTIDHMITDGLGALHLLQLLLTPTLPSDLPFESLSSVRLLEDTMNMKPTLSYLIPVVFRKLLLPYIPLPAFVRKWLEAAPTWPGDSLLKGPLEVGSLDWDCASLELDVKQIEGLKKTTKAIVGAKATLQPVLVMAFSFAIWAEHTSITSYKACQTDEGRVDTAPLLASTSKDTFHFEAGTPRSERVLTLGHGMCTGNYVSDSSYNGSIGPETRFWSKVEDLASDLVSVGEIRRARGAVGMLAHVPDGQIEEVSGAGGNLNAQDESSFASRIPTKWEEYFLHKAGSTRPISQALKVSNLGYAPLAILPGATDLAWGFSANPFSSAVQVSAIGHEHGMRLMLQWLEGVVFTRDEMERLIQRAKRIFAKLASGSNVDLTAGELAVV